MNKKILILGGTGYIGSRLYLFLKDLYETVDTVDLCYFGNFVNEKNYKIDYTYLAPSYINNYDVIILFASHSSLKMCEDQFSSYYNNVFNFSYLNRLLDSDKTFIYASSSYVYGNITDRNVVTEDTKFSESNSFYDLLKQRNEEISSLRDDLLVFPLRFGSVNGFSPNFRTDVMINSMSYNAINDKKINVYNPHMKKPVFAMSDLCRAIHAIIENANEENAGSYNLSSFNDSAINIATGVLKQIDAELNIIDNTTNNKIVAHNKTYNYSLNSEKFSNVFNFKFEGNIENITKEILDNYKNIKNFQNRICTIKYK